MNIGARKRGRLQAESVVNCKPTRINIAAYLSQLYSTDFQSTLHHIIKPYDEGGASGILVSTLKILPTLASFRKFFLTYPSIMKANVNK